MGIVVQKYGGKLVENKEKMQKIANIIASNYENGNQVVAVISAIGNTTDELNNKILEICSSPVKREVDVVLSSGEQIAIGLLSIMLNEMGYKAISLCGWQAGIITDNIYTNSNIINIDTNIISKYLENGYIVIIAGFQGIDGQNNITTLGRGGSDTTATELAVNLNADVCEIYKDTKCIFTADPKIISTAKKINHISYKHMIELSKMGAKVLATKSIEYASKHDLNLVIKSVENDEIGTKINMQESEYKYAIVSCTNKKYGNNLDIITFIINDQFNIDDVIANMESIVKNNGINEYAINKKDSRVSIVLSSSYSYNVLKQIHDRFILD